MAAAKSTANWYCVAVNVTIGSRDQIAVTVESK